MHTRYWLKKMSKIILSFCMSNSKPSWPSSLTTAILNLPPSPRNSTAQTCTTKFATLPFRTTSRSKNLSISLTQRELHLTHWDHGSCDGCIAQEAQYFASRNPGFTRWRPISDMEGLQLIFCDERTYFITKVYLGKSIRWSHQFVQWRWDYPTRSSWSWRYDRGSWYVVLSWLCR